MTCYKFSSFFSLLSSINEYLGAERYSEDAKLFVLSAYCWKAAAQPLLPSNPENAAKYVTEHLVKTEAYRWRLVGKTESQGNGRGNSRMAEGIRINVKIIHGPFSAAAPTYFSNLQSGNSLSPVAASESNSCGVSAGFFIAAWPQDCNHLITSIYLHWIPFPFQWTIPAMSLYIPLAIMLHLL